MKKLFHKNTPALFRNVYFYHKLKCCGNQWNKKGAKIFFKIKRQKITFAVIASERIRWSSGRAAARYGSALSKRLRVCVLSDWQISLFILDVLCLSICFCRFGQ